ncbi:DUF4882 family protein [Acinetobacter sp. VNH17]|uniref:DUF4882 family protein n=1 Tax=Acinetobacter thutiue TaxID=2998078 RepID=A0ABT7WKS6_9GAMM|nr:DUF4882 family protein [Acinetobacter thutiue]MCY6411188.1 DUF4882 family protein [Acinetobacter thutiue]MDN0013290.1 DUF4882 family protein [Acinetobacter thutiue]
MKSIILGVLINTATIGSAFATCTYNLDATPIEISQLYSGQNITEKFPTVVSQDYGYKVTSTSGVLNSLRLYAAGSSTFVQAVSSWDASNSKEATLNGDITLPATGIYAIEFKINSFPYSVLSGSTEYNLGAMIIGTSNNQRGVNIIPTLSNTSTGLKLKIEIVDKLGGTYYTVSYPVPTQLENFRYGIYFNQDSKQLGVIVNGINKGYIGSPMSNKIDALGIILQGRNYNIPSYAAYLNKNITAKLITDKNQIIFNYPVGTKDICGNTI